MAQQDTSRWNELQVSFSGGEVSPRIFNRDDTEIHSKSLLTMENFIPTLQGTAVRAPGSSYVYSVPNNATVARLIPYLTPANERALLELTPGQYRILPGIIDELNPSTVLDNGVQISTQAQVLTKVWKQVKSNNDFAKGGEDWEGVPLNFVSTNGDELGVEFRNFAAMMTARLWVHKLDPTVVDLYGTCTIPEDETTIQVEVDLTYMRNFTDPAAAFECFIRLGTAKGLGDIYEFEYDFDVGFPYQAIVPVSGTFTQGQVIHMTCHLEAKEESGLPHSTPWFRLRSFGIYSRVEVDLGEAETTGTMPYTAEELPDVQYVQSPYTASAAGNKGKELVFTHPNHPPQELLFNPDLVTPAYVWSDKTFTNQPTAWAEGNYPAACTSFHGRLILAGSQDQPLLGSPTQNATETVWGTEVGKWNLFSAVDEVDPDDSIEFTAIYRSPIRWVYGQKDLLIGAVEMEYIASADGIFQPGDLGVFMHSTHGSNGVQPAGMGQTVLFPAEQGTKVRAMTAEAAAEGYVSPDLTLLHPELCKSGIVRMVRMRNPHQMMVALLGNGQLAVLHQDSYAGIEGWSRINLNEVIKDICVITDADGTDILMCTVVRYANGVQNLYVEAFTNWLDGSEWNYLQCNSVFVAETPTSTISGLEHLEGRVVGVVGDGNYLGTFQVESGVITLIDGAGFHTNVTTALVGLSMSSRLRTMPLVTSDPGSKKRYPKLSVRALGSSRPIINGQRPADRTPATAQDTSEPLDIVRDYDVTVLGSNKTQIVEIKENQPVRCEIIGVYGTVKGNSL